MSYEIRLVGGGTVGRRITDRLEYRGDSVTIIERDADRSRTLEAEGYRVVHGDGTDVATLDDADVDEADVVVVATGDDDANLLAAQLVRNRFDPDSVVARVNRPENEDPFEELGIETISQSDATADLLDCHIESPAMTRLMQTVGQGGDVQEVAVRNPDVAGSTVSELDERLPEQVLLAMVGGEGEAHLPDRDEVVEQDDHVTLIGTRTAVRTAMDDLTGDEVQRSEPKAGERARQRR